MTSHPVIEPARTFGLALGLALLGGCPSNDTTDDAANDTGTAADEIDSSSSATDSGSTDSGSTESGSTDTGSTDSGTTESGSTDSGSTDSGTSESGSTESGTSESGSTDSGSSDSGTDTMGGAVTIYAIQDGSVPLDTEVEVLGVWVTGVRPNGFFAQELPGGQFSGIFVFVGNMGPDISGLAIGDVVDIGGIATDFGGQTEIDAALGTVTEVDVVVPPAPDLVTMPDLDPANAEPWESVFVRLESDLGVSGLPGGDEFEITDPEGSTIVDNFLYNLIVDGGAEFPMFGVGATFTAIQGVLNFSATFKLAPRSAADLEGYMPSANPVVGVDDLVPGDLVITEVMYDPNKNACTEPGCEWIEIYNATDAQVDLLGLRVQDSQLMMAAQGTIMVSVIVPPGGYAWLGHLANGWPYVEQPDAFMGNNPSFNNSGSDSAAILNTDGILDQTAAYATQGATDNGVSWKLKAGMPDATANDMAGNWCWSTTAFDVDLGSPGVANEAGCNPNLPQ